MAFVVTAVLLPLLGLGCTRDAAGRAVERFLDLYYIELNQEAALALSVGPAAERCRSELGLTRVARASIPQGALDRGRPRITYKEVYRQPSPPSPEGSVGMEILYEFEFQPQGSAPFVRTVRVRAIHTADGWKVIHFQEEEPS